MSNWQGFTGRLRKHAKDGYYTFGATTQGYLNTAARRIEELEEKLVDTEAELHREKEREQLRSYQR